MLLGAILDDLSAVAMNAAPDDFSVTSALFGAALGLLFAYLLWSLQQWLQLKERRRNLATAMLIEMWSLDWVLRLIYKDEEAAISHGSLPAHLFAEAHRNALEFPPDVVFRIMLFRGLCQDIDILRERSRSEFEKARESTENRDLIRFKERHGPRHHKVRAKAGFALTLIPELKQDFKKCGGVWRDPGPVKETPGEELPEVPPSPFHHSSE